MKKTYTVGHPLLYQIICHEETVQDSSVHVFPSIRNREMRLQEGFFLFQFQCAEGNTMHMVSPWVEIDIRGIPRKGKGRGHAGLVWIP